MSLLDSIDEPIPVRATAQKREGGKRPNGGPTPFERACKYVEKMPGGIQGQGGSVPCMRAAVAAARGFGLAVDATVQVLQLAHNPNCTPEWPEDELRHKAEDAFKSDRVPLGYLLDASRRYDGDHGVTDDGDLGEPPPWVGDEVPRNEPGDEDWPEPIPLDHVGELPPFPLQVLPAPLAEWAQAVAVSAQVPVDLPALLGLSVVSALCAKRFDVEVRDGWVEPVNLYVAVVLPPGERKSSVFRLATEYVAKHEADRVAEERPRIARAATAHAIKEAQLKKAISEAAKTGKPEKRELAQTLANELDGMRVPAAPRYFCDDATPEKLAVLMFEQGGRMGLFSAEGGVFEIVAGRYTDSQVNLDLMLKSHPGDYFRQDRIGRAPVLIQRPALTLGLAVQPSVVAGLASRPELVTRGLFARFAYSFPRSLVGRRDQNPPAVPHDVRRGYEKLLASLLAGDPKRDESGEIVPTMLRLEPEALDAITSVARSLEPRLAPGGDLEVIRDLAAKHMGLLVRIIALSHLAAGNLGIVGISVLERQNLESLSLYLLQHGRAAFALMGADENAAAAQRLLSWIRKEGLSTFSKRDAWQGCKGSFKRADDLDKPLALLVEHEYLRELPKPVRTKAGRPASPEFVFSPKGHNTHNAQNGGRP